MKRRRGSLLAGSSILVTVSCAAIEARADGKPDAAVPVPVATSTVAAGLSARDLELARYLDVLEHMDLLEDYECLELMPVLEDDHEP